MVTTVQSKLTLAPVFYTLAQVRFNPVAQMSDYVAPLQERLRRSGFPDFQEENQVGITIRRLDDPQPDLLQERQKLWIFTNTEKTEGYILLSNALVFHTTAYNTFEDFLQKTLFGLKLVNEIVELAFVERIGLRYLDAVVPTENETLEQYLNPSLLGLAVIENGELSHSFTETVTSTEGGTLVARALISENGLALPADLSPLRLNLKPRFAEVHGRHAVLDTDYFVAKRQRTFDVAAVQNQLLASHEITSETFKRSVTVYALERWA